MPTDADARPVHHLTPDERGGLALVNHMLTEMTRTHHHYCECELCEARVLTDVQDEAAYHVPYEPAEGATDAG